MIRVAPRTLTSFPSIDFPLQTAPSIWIIERTSLRTAHGKRIPAFLWVYLKRRVAGSCHFYDPLSFSSLRALALPRTILRLSDHFRLQSASSKTVYAVVSSFARFLLWIDSEEHGGEFEDILSDPDLALKALELYHRYLKSKIQSNKIARNSAANADHAALQAMGVIHNRAYFEEIQKIRTVPGRATKAPESDVVALWMSTLTAIFDSACRILDLSIDSRNDGTWRLATSTIDESNLITLPLGYSRVRLMELAALSYVGLVIGDSGANLAQIQTFEEPSDLLAQLSEPDRVSLTQKVVKLRAGGKAVSVTLTAITFSRLKKFLEIRQKLIELLKCNDISPFFFKCEYAHVQARNDEQRTRIECMEPIAIRPIADYLSDDLRNKVAAIGTILPVVTLRQLRAHRQQHMVRHYGLNMAAEVMGHSIETAVRAYCAANESVQANDIGRFMSSLHKTVIRNNYSESIALVSVPVGGCISHGKPENLQPIQAVEPDCTKMEGCFFCEQYRIHADENDIRKLASCQYVLRKIGHLQGDSIHADSIYKSVLDRIESLLHELRQYVDFDTFHRITVDVAAGNLTRYWAVKVQQLGLLGLISNK